MLNWYKHRLIGYLLAFIFKTNLFDLKCQYEIVMKIEETFANFLVDHIQGFQDQNIVEL